jgi:hypothetical protein
LIDVSSRKVDAVGQQRHRPGHQGDTKLHEEVGEVQQCDRQDNAPQPTGVEALPVLLARTAVMPVHTAQPIAVQALAAWSARRSYQQVAGVRGSADGGLVVEVAHGQVKWIPMPSSATPCARPAASPPHPKPGSEASRSTKSANRPLRRSWRRLVVADQSGPGQSLTSTPAPTEPRLGRHSPLGARSKSPVSTPNIPTRRVWRRRRGSVYALAGPRPACPSCAGGGPL